MEPSRHTNDILMDVGENDKPKYTNLSELFSKLLQKWEF